jgi:hypothetical protein
VEEALCSPLRKDIVYKEAFFNCRAAAYLNKALERTA